MPTISLKSNKHRKREMNINILSGIKHLNTVKTDNTKRNNYKKAELKQDTFVRSTNANINAGKEGKSDFDLTNAVEELKNAVSFKGTKKFKEEQIEELQTILKEHPEKWNAIKAISQQPKMIGSLVMGFARYDTDKLNAIVELSQIKKEDEKEKFSPMDLRNLAKEFSGEELLKVGKLSDTKLDSGDIAEIARNKNITDIDKLTGIINKFEASSSNVRRVSFKRDEFDENGYNIRLDIENNGSKILLLDKDMQTTALEVVNMERSKEGYLQQVKKTNDYKNNTVSKVISVKSPSMPQPIVTEETRIIKDKSGRTIRKEIYSLSDLAGTPNIKYIYPDGSEKIVSSGIYDENSGKATVKKDMISLDGTRTEYLYEDEPSGNMISSYKITDKDGKVLYSKNSTFTVLDENTFISTENDKKYEIKFAGRKINIKDINNGKTITIDLEEKTDGEKDKIIATLKRMPAEELIALNNTTNKLTGVANTYASNYSSLTRTIQSGDNLFIVLHEAGHAKDYEHVADVKQRETLRNAIFSKPEVNKIFEEEKSAFNEAFPLAQRDHISYFIKTSEYKDGLQEAIAETNALINTKNTEDLFSIRSHYLQQYFPKTIAVLAQIMD